jgi:bacillithiol biosynthesis cysteine-adding enzyme BshC
MQLYQSVSLGELKFQSQLLKDYFKGDRKLSPYYSFSPSLEGLKMAAAKRKFTPEHRLVLTEVLETQYAGLDTTGPVMDNINKLKEEHTFTLTTGHQLCVYTGPAYFIYKIASVINLVKQIRKVEPSMNFVPVFWLASEDHDFEEISEVNFYGKSWKWQDADPRAGQVPVGLISPEAIAAWGEEMKQYFRNDKNAEGILDIFITAYRSNQTLSAATRQIVHELFKDSGLVVIDGNDKRLKKLFQPVLVDEIEYEHSFVEVVKTSEALHAIGYSTPVTPRRTHLFYLSEENLRQRIDKNRTTYIIHGTEIRWGHPQIIKAIRERPECFSPNVVLRPLYQETVLPNIAYIGGPAEVAYWLQLKGMFTKYKTDFPCLLQRSSFAVLPSAVIEKSARYEFTFPDYLDLETDEIINKFIKKDSPEDLSFEKENALIETLVKELRVRAGKIDQQLQTQVSVEEHNLRESIQRLQGKFTKAMKQKSDVDIKVFQKIKGILFPENNLQERYINFLGSFATLKDPIAELIELADPLANEMKILDV